MDILLHYLCQCLSLLSSSAVAGFRKRINVYDSFVEGAEEGFSTAVRIIPYLVAILVGIGVFRASGAMDYLIDGIGNAVKLCGIDSDTRRSTPYGADETFERKRGTRVMVVP